VTVEHVATQLSAPKPRWLPGLPLLLCSGLLGVALMANQSHLRGGVVLGALSFVIAAISLLDLTGSFEALPEIVTTEAKPTLGRYVAMTTLGLGAFILVTRMAVAGTLPGARSTSALLIPLLLVLTLAMLYRAVAALGVFGASTHRAISHPSFWLLAVTIAVYTPMLGSFSLIDPWETHYGEVAREILSRDDWISLWWAQDGWFWSKPVLDFWLQALSFSLFDVGTAPDHMLSAIAQGRTPYPEWAARLPMLLCSLVGQILLYAGVRRTWGRAAALLGSLVLMAVPHYAIIAHQSMTDLPYIAALMGAMGLFLLGLFCPPQALVDGYAISVGRRRCVVTAHALVVGLVILFALPQIAYLLTRNLGLVTVGRDLGFFTHLDSFFAGSGGGNCGLPGNEACSRQFPVNAGPQPAVSALFWAVLLATFLMMNRGERRRQRLYFISAWILVALSFMAKGLPGPIIAVATFGVACTIMRRWGDFEQFEFASGLLAVALIALPWFAQMTVRHGPAFLERLFVHDMYKRAFLHVHDTNTGDDTSIHYYLWQLGYGLFPATGIIAVTSIGSFFGRGEHKDRKQATTSFLGAWFLVGFAMFSLTLTKFHHYVIAVVPPICMLCGLFLSRTLESCRDIKVGDLRNLCSAHATRRPSPTHAALQLLVVLSAISVTWFVGVDLFSANPPNGPVRLINLVTYNYSRPWPAHLSMGSVVFGFTIAVSVVMLGWVGRARLGGLATALFLAICIGFSAWVCNVYLPRIAPHWGQRDTIAEYYRRRHGPDELLVSYQMNWKGENFYTGNRTPAFITTGDAFKRFIEAQRTANRRVLFFVLEHSRIGNLRYDLGKYTRLDSVTDTRLNNKFALVRVEL
jgi:4-amino-4-deoxy-L-arabinose transferase-like glycosyltransferase